MSGLTPHGKEMLRLEGVSKHYPRAKSAIGRIFDKSHSTALDNVSIAVGVGDSLGIVGESGSGKTTLARLMIRLIEPTAGSVYFKGQSLGEMSREQSRSFRDQVQMVFQSTHTSLNPRKTIATALTESFRREDGDASLTTLLDMARLPGSVLDKLPHQLSGGQRQRVGIARAIARRPEVIIADEPTSALDVSLQGEVIELLRELHRESRLTLIVISHDLAMVAALCSTVAVMHNGKIVERGSAPDVLRSPSDPYTKRLIDAIPRGIRRLAPATI